MDLGSEGLIKKWDESLLLEPSLLPSEDALTEVDGRTAFLFGAECCMWLVTLTVTGKRRIQRSVRKENEGRLRQIAERQDWVFETADIEGVPSMIWAIATRGLEIREETPTTLS